MKHPSVLDSVRPLIREWLGFRYETKTGAISILRNPLKAPDLTTCFQAIAPIGLNRSKLLWKWRSAEVIADQNSSEEKILEKAAVCHLPKSEWANQVVTASGLSFYSGDNRRNIDLVNRTGPGRYRFIELKTGESDNPVYAAVELLEYALLYWWSRQHPETHKAERENKELFAATHIAMEILAPNKFYAGYDTVSLRNLSDVLTKSFNRLTRGQLEVKFKFTVLELPSKGRKWDKQLLEMALSNPPGL